MQKFSRTWSLMRASWQLLKQDKEILVFPVISAVCCLLVMASFAVPMFLTEYWRPPGTSAPGGQQVAYYAVLFLFYVANYFVVIFFQSAMVACAAIRMRGGDPTVADGLRAAMSRLHLILGWALVSATVGMVLKIIEDRSKWLGRFVAGLLGMAWTLATFMVIPVMVVEQKGPFAALKESAVLLKKTWGEQLISNVSFGLVFTVLAIPGILLMVAGFFTGSTVGVIACLALGMIYLLLLATVQSALQAIFNTALYLYAREGQVPAGFESGMLDSAMAQK